MKKASWSTQVAINIGAVTEFPNKTILVNPPEDLSGEIKKSLDK